MIKTLTKKSLRHSSKRTSKTHKQRKHTSKTHKHAPTKRSNNSRKHTKMNGGFFGDMWRNFKYTRAAKKKINAINSNYFTGYLEEINYNQDFFKNENDLKSLKTYNKRNYSQIDLSNIYERLVLLNRLTKMIYDKDIKKIMAIENSMQKNQILEMTPKYKPYTLNDLKNNAELEKFNEIHLSF